MLSRKMYLNGLVVTSILIGFCCQTASGDTQCDDGWTFFDYNHIIEGNSNVNIGACFLPVEKPLSHSDAEKFCQEVRSYVLNLDTLDQLKTQRSFLNDFLLTNFTDVFWSGMKVSSESGRLVWHGFGPVYVERGEGENRPWDWRPGVPNISKTCGKVQLRRIGTPGETTTSSPDYDVRVEVELVPCTNRLPFVCGKSVQRYSGVYVDI